MAKTREKPEPPQMSLRDNAPSNKPHRASDKPWSFAEELRKAMAEQNLSVKELYAALRQKCTGSTLYANVNGSRVTDDLALLNELAKLLHRSPDDLRWLAARDQITRTLKKYESSWDAFLSRTVREEEKRHLVPVYEMSDFDSCISPKGGLVKKPAFHIESWFLHPEDAYGLLARDNRLRPRLLPGDIGILSAKHTPRKEEYGLVGSRNGLFLGKVMSHRAGVNVEVGSGNDYDMTFVPKADVKFIHWVVTVHYYTTVSP